MEICQSNVVGSILCTVSLIHSGMFSQGNDLKAVLTRRWKKVSVTVREKAFWIALRQFLDVVYI